LTLGAFDVSVQPLWTLYATHFFGNIAPPAKGPTPQAIERVRNSWTGGRSMSGRDGSY
jgi:thiamine biosynthesis lipoprotein ApbE